MKLMFLIAAGSFVITPIYANAACADDVDAFAKQFGLNVTTTKSSGGSQTMSDKLAASGGVITPPATGADMVIKRPATAPEPMETAPKIVPQTNGKTAPNAAVSDSATKTQAEALLASAREAGLKGDEAACQQHLMEAGKLFGKTKQD